MDNGNQPIDLLALQDAAKGTRRRVSLLKRRTVRVTGRPKGIAGFRPTKSVKLETGMDDLPAEPPKPKPHRASGVLMDPKTPLT